MKDILEPFRQAMRNAGIEPPAAIIVDGSLHRFSVAGDRAKSENGWYCLHADDPAAGAFGCWKRGISEKWCGKIVTSMTTAEKSAYQSKVEAIKQQREQERQRINAECRSWCADVWNKAPDATDEHPYIKRKGVKAHGLKTYRDSLLVPVQDVEGDIHGLEFIGPDGGKRFKTGTDKYGHFFKIGGSGDEIIICEGYATGATIHEATGAAVIVAFDAGNLLPVAQNIRAANPDAQITIAADDDATEGNPGLTKATEAARAINGLLAVPVFSESRGPKDSDFNDFARLAGLEVVRTCIEGATRPTEDGSAEESCEGQDSSLDSVIQRLAALSPLEYDRVRKAKAKALGVRPGTLDDTVKGARKSETDNNLPFDEVDPWPEPVNPSRLLTDIAETIRRFIICEEETARAAALWVAMTWFVDVIQVAPLAVITAPEKRCGKTLLLSLLGKLAARAVTASNISPAALYRTVEAWSPTLLIDEADAFLKDNEELRGLINSGHTRDSAYVIRCTGDDSKPTKFSTWGCKAISGIGHVADTLMDRAVILELRRRLPHEKVERIRHAEPKLWNELQAKLARFAEDYSDRVRQARPPLPESLNDRAADNWEGLLQIAMTAGNEWLRIGTDAALKLSGSETITPTIGVELLANIQEIFGTKRVDRIFTADLIEALCEDDEKPWATYNRGKSISPRQVAKKLKGYGIETNKTIRIGGRTARGFLKEQFSDVFSRYVNAGKNNTSPFTPSLSATELQPLPVKDLRDFSSVTQEDVVSDKKQRKPAPLLDCCLVADKYPLTGEESIFEEQTDLFKVKKSELGMVR